MINKLNSKNTIILVVLVVILLLLGWVFLINYQPDSKAKYGKLDRYNLSSLVNIRYLPVSVSIKTKTVLPKAISVYKIDQRYFGRAKAQEIAQRLGFQNEPTILKAKDTKTNLNWSQAGKALNINETTGQISYSNPSAPISDTSQNFLSEAELITRTEQVLKDFGFGFRDLTVDAKNIKYFTGSGEDVFETEDKSKANFVELNFNLRIAEKELFLEQPSRSPVQFLLTRAGEIFQFYYSIVEYTSDNAVYPVNTLEQITPRFVKKYGVVVSPSTAETLLDSKLIKSIVVEDIELVYVDDGVSKYLMPTYLLRGVATLGQDEILVALYVPAITERWLK